MADERRSDQQVAGAFGALIQNVENAKTGVVPEPVVEEEDVLLDTTEDELDVTEQDEEFDLDDDDEPLDDSDEIFLTAIYNGEEVPLKKDEAVVLAQKGMHFDKKMNALSAEQRDWEQKRTAEEQALMQQHQEYATILPQLRQQVEAYMGSEPNWVELSQQVTPAEFTQVQAQWNEAMKKLNAARAEEQRMQQVLGEQHARRMHEWQQSEADLTLERIPEWRDESTRDAAKSEIGSYLMGLGVPPDALSQIHDHVFWQVLRDAVQGRQAASVGSKEVQRAGTKAATPGSGKQKTSRQRRRTKQRQRARQGGGRVEDLAPLMAELISPQR